MSSSTSSSDRRSRGLLGYRFLPLWVGALVYGVLLVLWGVLVGPVLPEQATPDDEEIGIILRPDLAGVPLFGRDEPEQAELIVVGDSRAIAGIHGRAFSEAGLPYPGLVWGAGARLLNLLSVIRPYPCRRLVVCLSPTSVHVAVDPVVAALFRRGVPSFAGSSSEERRGQAIDWIGKVVQELGLDLDPTLHVDGIMEFLEGRTRSDSITPREIDRRLNRWLDLLRGRWVPTLRTATWQESWFPHLDPNASNEGYLQSLAEPTREQRKSTLAQIALLLVELEEEGWDIVCLRLPMSKELLQIEEEAFASGEFTQLCADLDLPFLDYSQGQYQTRDGSHLTGPSGLRFSRDLAAELAMLKPGWR